MIMNLDQLAARHGQEIVRELSQNKANKASAIDNTVTKALAVLQENGIYACIVYLFAKEKKHAEKIIKIIISLLSKLSVETYEGNYAAEKVLDYIAINVTGELEIMLLCKEVMEKMFIYARYGAKALARE